MIEAGLTSGLLRPGQTIIDATSGNTGIAYAMIGAALGYPVKLCLPDSASHERKRILTAYGAELVITPGDEGPMERSAAFAKSSRTIRTNTIIPISTAIPPIGRPTSAPPQMKSGSNLPGSVTHFIAGLGTSGTFVGTARRPEN